MNTVPHLPGYVVLARTRESNTYQAIVELSWAMDLSSERALFCWTSANATSNLGGNFNIDGLKTAEHLKDMFKRGAPEMEFEIWDVHDPNLPIIIDWDGWYRDSQPDSNKFSGVRNKMGARNPKFIMKE